jgi:hypothetical protein
MMAYSASIFVGTDRQPHIVHEYIRGGDRGEQELGGGACGAELTHESPLASRSLLHRCRNRAIPPWRRPEQGGSQIDDPKPMEQLRLDLSFENA